MSSHTSQYSLQLFELYVDLKLSIITGVLSSGFKIILEDNPLTGSRISK